MSSQQLCTADNWRRNEERLTEAFETWHCVSNCSLKRRERTMGQTALVSISSKLKTPGSTRRR
jgi:hypothetical protein